MKKPHVLNRPMFNTGGTSAYGRGITSNLVSDEQRQRFNSGGRVGLQDGTQFGQNWQPLSEYLKPAWDWWKQGSKAAWGMPGLYSEGETMGTVDEEEITYQDPFAKGKTRYYQKKAREEEDKRLEAEGRTRPGGEHPLAFKYEDPIVEEVGEKEPSWAGIPGEGDPSAASTITKDDTDLLDTPDKWAFLDEQQKAKQKLARGYGLAEAAAGAVRWSTEGTAKGRSKAIADTLSKVGAIGAKYKGEATDLKTKAKILGTVEEIKGEQKIKEWELKMKEWYTPSLEQAKEAQEWKKGRAIIADELAKDKSGKEIYANILQPKEIKSAQDQQKAILSLTEQYLTIEDDKNSKELRDPEKNGLVFITKLGEIVKNNNGSIDPINPLTDPFFTWKD